MGIFSKKKAIALSWSKIKSRWLFLADVVLFIGIVNFVLNIPLISEIVGLFLLFVLIRISFDLLNNVSGDLADLFLDFRLFINFLAASILYVIIVGVGLILFIIPGVIWAIKFQLFPFFIIDKNSGPVEALKKSALKMKDSHINMLLLDILLLMIALVIRALFAIISFAFVGLASFIILVFTANSETARSVAGVLDSFLVSVGWIYAFVVSTIAWGYIYRRLLDPTWVVPETEVVKVAIEREVEEEAPTLRPQSASEVGVPTPEGVGKEKEDEPEMIKFNDDDAWIHELPKEYYAERQPEAEIKQEPEKTEVTKEPSSAKAMEGKEKLLKEPEHPEMIEEISDKPLIEEEQEEVHEVPEEKPAPQPREENLPPVILEKEEPKREVAEEKKIEIKEVVPEPQPEVEPVIEKAPEKPEEEPEPEPQPKADLPLAEKPEQKPEPQPEKEPSIEDLLGQFEEHG